MTTPERLKRRQLIEGSILILLAIFTVMQGIYFNVQQGHQASCVEDKFSQLSVALGKRAHLSGRETTATKRVLLFAAHSSQNPPKTPEEQQKVQKQFKHVPQHYSNEINAIQQYRQNHPLPPYPVGACGQ